MSEKELPELMRKIMAYEGSTVTRFALQLMALTFVRTSELIGARWEEFELDAAQWRIAQARMKKRRPKRFWPPRRSAATGRSRLSARRWSTTEAW